MARDHYLPAAFIGRFSNDTFFPARDRSIFVYDRKKGITAPSTPNKIGFKKGLYDLRATHGATSIDKWSYEGRLSEVLDALASSDKISLDDWIHILVPFVSGLFIRGDDFN